MSFWDWVSDALPTLISVGATAYGTHQQTQTMNQAAGQATQAQQGATAAELESIRAAEELTRQQQRQASPGLLQTQSIIARGETLTPDQKLALDEARRRTVDTLQGGSLRGSARATADTIKSVEGDMRTGFMAQNRQRADQAASTLTGQYFNAGNNVANLNLASGKSVSAGLINSGDINSLNTMGQGAIQGKAIGDIGAVIADQIKASNNEARDSSYEKIDWNTERQGAV